jgi:hypothetical protein
MKLNKISFSFSMPTIIRITKQMASSLILKSLMMKLDQNVKLAYYKKRKRKNDFNKQQIKTFEITNVASSPHFSIKNFTLVLLPLFVPPLTAFSFHRPQIPYCSITYIYKHPNTIRLR